MDQAALYHRPDSEMAFIYTRNEYHIYLRTKHGDVAQVKLLFGDPYDFEFDEKGQRKWNYQEVAMIKDAETLNHDYWKLAINIPQRRLQYAFWVEGKDGEQVIYDDRRIMPYNEQNLARMDCFIVPFVHLSDEKWAPNWVRQTVWYQLFADRFANGNVKNDPPATLPWGDQAVHPNACFGGDLAGLIKRLDYLKDLGVNGIYLMPIFTAYSSTKFDTVDYFSIDPSLGTKAEFKQLVDELHKRNMRIMLDGVFSYMSDTSLQWQDVQEKGRASRFADWFQIRRFPVGYKPTDNPDIAYDLTYNVHGNNPHMPQLNTANPAVRKYLLGVAAYWTREFNIDGWHLEYAAEVDQKFWREFATTVREINPEIYLVGEVKHSNQRIVQPGKLDGVVNYPVTEAITRFAANKELSVAELISVINDQMALYRDQTNEVMFNAVESHVTQRLLATCHGDSSLVRMILALTFLQIGTPSLFYGTEVGMTNHQAPRIYQSMIWDEDKQDKKMLRFVKVLTHFRHNFAKLLSYGDFQWGPRSNKYNYLSLTRQLGKHQVFALFNFGYTAIKFVRPQNSHIILSQNLLDHEEKIGSNGFLIIELTTQG
ncbi:alpha-glycosidase [Ligilactobacillus saerimneri]|uniref:Alpha-glycosidase n=1 Tax=Ligilactobacillus saerimneri TaxID=228229 RepID=A0A7H9EJC8_9LACO|nr:glycoside hydrolase family 13 protein [Ligilactobacillus saerimneri]QLL77245.1 alpha-glycosidase [Ligilactobacillus saerimneri]